MLTHRAPGFTIGDGVMDMPRKKLWSVFLNENEARMLREIAEDRATSTTVRKRCLAILYSDESGGLSRHRKDVANMAGVSLATVKNVVKLYCKYGIDGVVKLKRNIKSDIGSIKVNADLQRSLAQLVKRQPPEGAQRWTLKMISREFERETGVRLGASTINRALKRGK